MGHYHLYNVNILDTFGNIYLWKSAFWLVTPKLSSLLYEAFIMAKGPVAGDPDLSHVGQGHVIQLSNLKGLHVFRSVFCLWPWSQSQRLWFTSLEDHSISHTLRLAMLWKIESASQLHCTFPRSHPYQSQWQQVHPELVSSEAKSMAHGGARNLWQTRSSLKKTKGAPQPV